MTTETDMLAQMRIRQSLRQGPEAKAVDTWLRTSLSDRFDDTLEEVLPRELAALVKQFQD